MRTSLISLAVIGTLLLAVPASAPAQDQASVPEAQAQGQEHAAAAAPAQQPAEEPGATVDPDQAQAEPAQTETTPEEPTPGDPGESDVPQQYTDPLAGQDDDDTPNQQEAETAPSTTGVQSVSAANQLPSTGTPAGVLALGGLALLGVGVAVRLLSRDGAYPYPYRRY